MTNNEDYYLVEELVIEILSKLPVKSLLRFKCVCKSWRKLIKSEEFIKYHLKYSKEINSNGIITLSCYTNHLSLNYYPPNNRHAIELHIPSFLDYYKSMWNDLSPPILVGSANGLVCFALPHNLYVLYNPSTRVFKEVPKVTRTYCNGFRIYSLLAYDRVNDEYKVFELFSYYDNYRRDIVSGVESLIFSTKSNLWKTIDIDVPYYKNNFVVTNDSICWVDRKRRVIRSFNFFNQTYDEDIRAIHVSNSRSSNGVKDRDFDILEKARLGDILEFALWNSYCWTVLPVMEYNVVGYNGLKDGQLSEGRCLDTCRENELMFTAKPWVESMVFPDIVEA